MSNLSRRKLITTGLSVTAGATGLAVAAKVAQHNGLIPPDSAGLFGAGETLTYAAQRMLTNHSMAREFPRSEVSNPPFVNGPPPKDDVFRRLQEGGFTDWRLAVDGLVARPAIFSLEQLKAYPSHSHITHMACEEGWSYIAEWTGVPLSHVLDVAGVLPHAKYVVYFSIDRDWWDSIDMADALHPQTLLSYGLNGGDLPVGNGGPLRMRVPRQLGYKNVKYITRLTVTDDLKKFGKGLGSSAPEAGYAWYAGI
jgi:DMSO/TMAO reductase YedYZ molybdopterin-dependent catalytic subunit